MFWQDEFNHGIKRKMWPWLKTHSSTMVILEEFLQVLCYQQSSSVARSFCYPALSSRNKHYQPLPREYWIDRMALIIHSPLPDTWRCGSHHPQLFTRIVTSWSHSVHGFFTVTAISLNEEFLLCAPGTWLPFSWYRWTWECVISFVFNSYCMSTEGRQSEKEVDSKHGLVE